MTENQDNKIIEQPKVTPEMFLSRAPVVKSAAVVQIYLTGKNDQFVIDLKKQIENLIGSVDGVNIIVTLR